MAGTGGGNGRAKALHPEGASGLSDWAGIQAHVADEDGERIHGYSEDVDAMLFFAGLFSAILTAFLVEIYHQLLPSTSETMSELLAQNNELLAANHRLLTQGFSAMLEQTFFKPSPVVLAARPSAFTSSTTARTINSLFFVSLVLSLAAALFGILVKQWLRHYMSWHSALSSPRENVLIRQFRFEAWQVWDVAIVVSMALALLETAMTLFLIGIIILLWTLDSVVAICVTVATSVFLLVQSVFTILPLVSKRCPYRTPAAWTVVLLFTLVTRGPSYCSQWLRRKLIVVRSTWDRKGAESTSATVPLGGATSASPTQPMTFSKTTSAIDKKEENGTDLESRATLISGMSWRTRDLQSCRATHRGLHRRADVATQVLSATTRIAERIVREFVPLPKDISEFREMTDFIADVVSTHGDHHNIPFLEELGEMGFLLGALFWVQKSAQDMQVTRYVEQCSRVELRDREKSLAWFLKVFSPRGPYEEKPTETVKKLRLFLLQFVLYGIGYPVTSGMQFEAYQDAVQNHRVIYSEDDERIVILDGQTQDEDYESLLMHYFGSRFEHANEDRLKMFVLTATDWLAHCGISGVSQDVVEDILYKMIHAAHALSKGPRQNTTRPSYLFWIWKLSEEKESLSALYGAQYRALLHALEKAYTRGMFSADEANIKHSLHVQLVRAHRGLTKESTPCEVPQCEWVEHTTCPGVPRKHYAGCPLLIVRPRTPALWRRAATVCTVLRMRRAWFHGHRRWRRAFCAVLFFVRVHRLVTSSDAASRRPHASPSSARRHRLPHHHAHHPAPTMPPAEDEIKEPELTTAVLPMYAR